MRAAFIHGGRFAELWREYECCIGASWAQWRSFWCAEYSREACCDVCRPALLIVYPSDPTHRYSYSKTRGLFGGISLEGTVIVEREDANALAYNSPVTAKMLLGGMVDPPEWAMPLIKTLEACTGMPGGRPWIDDDTRPSHSRTYSFGSGIGSDSISSQPSSSSRTPSFLRRKKQPQSEFPPAHWGVHSPGGSYSASEASRELSEAGNDYHSSSSARASFQTQFDSNFNPVPTFVSKARVHDDIIPPYNEDPLVASATLRGPQRSNSLYTPTSGRFNGRTTSSNLLDDSKDWEDERVEDPFGGPVSRSKSFSTNTHTYTAPKSELEPPLTDGVGRAIAMYRFDAKEVSIIFALFCFDF